MSSHDGSGALLGRLWTSPTASSSLCKSSKEGENCANVVWQDCLHCLHGHSLAAQRLNTVALDLTSCEAVFPATFRGRFADLGDGLEISSPGFSVLGKDGQVSQACAYSHKGLAPTPRLDSPVWFENRCTILDARQGGSSATGSKTSIASLAEDVISLNMTTSCFCCMKTSARKT